MNKMRFTLASLALTAGMLTSSCGNDDGPRASITGKWEYLKTITQVDNQNPSSVNYPGHEPGCDKDYQEFLADESFRDVALFQDQDDNCNEFTDTGDYALNGDLLTIERDGDVAETFTVTKLTGAELRYESTATTGGVAIKVTQVFRKK